MRNTAVLVLNATYEPIGICSWRRAVILVVKEKALIEQHHERFIHVGLMLPSVIRLKTYRHVPHRVQELTRRNVYVRDRYKCCYCDTHFPGGRGLTLDHIIPKSHGGRSSWENLCAACETCNRRKADRTPEEAGMPLLRVPRPMTIHSSRHLMRTAGSDEKMWRQYLYY